MSKAFTVICWLTLSVACTEPQKPETRQAKIHEHPTAALQLSTDTLKVDLKQSKIFWKGTKMRGRGKHEGRIRLRQAFFTKAHGQLQGGRFIADMHSIEVTDIPSDEPVPRNRFLKHIKGEEFFNVDRYPESEFEITKISKLTGDSLKISGNLTIKNITKPITFTAEFKNKVFITRFTIDRFEWDIAYKGSWIDKTLVDKEIEFRIEMITR